MGNLSCLSNEDPPKKQKIVYICDTCYTRIIGPDILIKNTEFLRTKCFHCNKFIHYGNFVFILK